MTALPDDLALDLRAGLPDALRVLLAEYPRAGWEQDRNFEGLVAFWLDRHMMFRRLIDLMRAGSEDFLDGKTDARRLAAGLSRHGGMFVTQLHGHHQIEDAHYFPVLAAREARIARGFDILDADHHALDGHLDGFVKGANAVLQRLDDPTALRDRTGRLRDDLVRLERFLDRHLVDEEDLVVPVILKYGAGGLG